MENLRKRYQRFLWRNGDKGIPHLMLWICAANAVVYFFSQFEGEVTLYSLLCFDAAAICRGEVWRLFTYVFTFALDSTFLFSTFLGALFSILFYYWVGNTLESFWGRLRFNLFYFSGMLLMDLFGVLVYLLLKIELPVSVSYINLSMFLAVATLIPEERLYLMFFIPVKMKWMALVYLGLTAYQITIGTLQCLSYWFATHSALVAVAYLLRSLFPLVALLNYFLFFGKQIFQLFPNFRRNHREQQRRATYYRQSQPNPNWADKYRTTERADTRNAGKNGYRHKCTVCGRTDTDCPDLEFRYCSKCAGYFCYCIDHINNHTHVQ